jgi:hypothetical protein
MNTPPLNNLKEHRNREGRQRDFGVNSVKRSIESRGELEDLSLEIMTMVSLRPSRLGGKLSFGLF